MAISKIIHQIAPKDKHKWHPLWHKCQQSWLEHFKDFEYRMWNDEEDINNLIKNNFADYYDLYSELPVHIMKIDFARFCILYEFGGIYADMDMFCYRNFFNELKNDHVFLLPAPYGTESTNGKNLIENALMISPPKSNFFKLCMDNSKKVFYSQVKKHEVKFPLSHFFQILIGNTAGPILVSNTFTENNTNVKILNPTTFNNHGLSFHESYATKHLLTGCWGIESSNLKEPNNYLKEVSKFANLENVTIDNFDFYRDYTNGGFLKEKDLVIKKIETTTKPTLDLNYL